jgi:hypothetical protein
VNFPGPDHFLFIPGVLIIGIVLGWMMGARAAREKLEEKQKRARE